MNYYEALIDTYNNSGEEWHDVPYGQVSRPESMAEDVCDNDHASFPRPACSLCGFRTGQLCSCDGAFHCSQWHVLQDTIHNNNMPCRDATGEKGCAALRELVIQELESQGIDPYNPPEEDDDDSESDDPTCTVAAEFQDHIIWWYEALMQMTSGTAVRKRLELLDFLNGEKFMDPVNIYNEPRFECYQTHIRQILLNRTEHEFESWLATVNWARYDVELARAEITGNEARLDLMYTPGDVPDITYPLRRIFRPEVFPWTSHSLECLVNHFLLKLKALLVLETVQNIRLLYDLRVRHEGVFEYLPPEIIHKIQKEAATPLLRWSPAFRRHIRRAESLVGLAHVLRCHVGELACHIESNNSAFWPLFMNPKLYLDDWDQTRFPVLSDPFIAQEVLQDYFPAFIETPGAVDWLRNEAGPLQFSLASIQQRFEDNNWGDYVD